MHNKPLSESMMAQFTDWNASLGIDRLSNPADYDETHNMNPLWAEQEQNKTQRTMTSSNRNIVRATGHLWGETTCRQCIPLAKTSNAELWCFLWSTPEPKVEQTLETPVIWDSIPLILTSL